MNGGGGTYTPDFGIVVTHRGIRDSEPVELHLVVETKSTDSLEALTQEEQIKIRCAIKHFESLGVSANTSLVYRAPVSRLDTTVQDEGTEYSTDTDHMGFYGPQNDFARTLNEATSTE